MNEEIIKKIAEIEARENVRVLHAIESGSRAWGFESPDSDYDVRFIYVRPAEFYLQLQPTSDVIEWQLDEVLDINGWDLNKALRLLAKSNMTLFEWDSSPIVYKTTDEWLPIRVAMEDYFSVKESSMHYLSSATGNYTKYIAGKNEVKLKKYLYVLRPLLCAQWILQYEQPAPMLFDNLVSTLLDAPMQAAVNELLAAKTAMPEAGTAERIDIIDDYIKRNMAELTSQASDLPKRVPVDWADLNKLFAESI